MRVAAALVCLSLALTGCIVQTSDTAPETATPSTPDRIEDSAKTPQEPKTPSSAEYDVDVSKIEDLVHKEMNERRRKNGVDPLSRSEKLDAIARYKSWDMAQQDYFAHESKNGTTHSMLRSEFNSSCHKSGQNILKHRSGADNQRLDNKNLDRWVKDSVNTLINSTGHRKNILDPDYEVQGIGVFVDENGTVFLTQEFCG